MAGQISFDEWWKDFSYQFRNDKDSGSAMQERLIFEVGTFSEEKQIAFIDEMLERTNFVSYPCELIPLFGNQRQINEIKRRAAELIENNLTEDILSIYLPAIIKTYAPSDLPLLTKYYLNYQNNYFFRIPIELYSIDKNLFIKAFTKYLHNYPLDKMCEYDGLLYLTKNVEVIEFLIQNLPMELSNKMKKFALAKSKHSIVNGNEKLKQQLLHLAGAQ